MTDSQPLLLSMKLFLQEIWKKSGFEKLTTIQSTTIPLIIEGRDIIAESPTGTGKTLSYLIPVLEKIDPGKKNVQAVILASSQELVMQILNEFQKWSEESGINGASLIGGANLKRQLEKLKKSPQLIVGTPGRTYELIKQKKLKMHEVKIIVLDEGDQLLVPEHLGTIKNIVKSTLSDRQVVLFSATLSPKTEETAKELTREAEIIRIKKDETIAASAVEHLYFICEQREKIEILEKISRVERLKGLAFMNDIGEIDVVSSKLNFKGIHTEVLHSELGKTERQRSLKDFRDDTSKLLLATDVAARGLDIKGITHVIHVDFPKDINQYVHRSGRTGRFGAAGTVISIVTEREERELKKFCREMGIALNRKIFYKGQIIDEQDRKKFQETGRPKPALRNKRF